MPSLINAAPPSALRITPPDHSTVDEADAYTATRDNLGDWLAGQRADAVRAGLVDPETGWPTKAGLINAAQQVGGALLMGTTAPGLAKGILPVAVDDGASQVANLKISRWGKDNQMFSVPVEYRKTPIVDPKAPAPPSRFGVDENGQAFYAGPHYPDDIQITRAIDAYLAPFGENTYIRSVNSPDDYNYLVAGTHQGSMDRSGGPFGRDAPAPLGGLSASHLPEFPSNYGYLVTGDRIGSGTDSEPLLNTATAKPASPLMKWDQFSQMVRDAQAERVRELGLSNDEYRALVSGHKRVIIPNG